MVHLQLYFAKRLDPYYTITTCRNITSVLSAASGETWRRQIWSSLARAHKSVRCGRCVHGPAGKILSEYTNKADEQTRQRGAKEPAKKTDTKGSQPHRFPIVSISPYRLFVCGESRRLFPKCAREEYVRDLTDISSC